MPSLFKRLAATLGGLLAAAGIAHAADKPKEIRLDYAYYSPPSLVLKHFGWLEEDFKADGVPIKWVLSQGSNRALEFLNSGSVDFGSTAGLAAVLSKANGNPIKSVYVFSRPEWTALLVAKDSPIKSLKDLKGKKIAATKGTDPFLFLLRSLHQEGLSKSDVEILALQHADGRAALEQGRVDAWAGLDPLMAGSEIQAGSRILHRNVAFNTYGFLNTTEAFAKQYPEQVRRVIAAYEKARKWIVANPAETARLLSEEAKLPLEVARLQLKRNDFSNPVPGAEHVAALKAAAPILVEEDLVRKGTNVGAAIDALVDPGFAKSVVK
ncbi:MAG TPA: aliphatic sulfonate ABC transporter substrate-binding protein [Zoogloea sp.]|mgnify:FL=1|jgi:sulfonate transport system substrate-binding protein|uniref:aliphatic sulfonate ABC transporter substrate-binding protein n=1 Tax=Zoogloea sp. TaxID=49181 RepID=UPI002C4A060E|nr:aliphatic sulfonate ABC transporter substrate-binding protein [Zoogloea sp.]HOB46537.1 aliphatic sulfonate ABC transporter substrate-binding protein [Zoogloea sp.]HQA09964.1 aliphatic sulfonate ABC transporter substrate-binding protein [Zoogloea sp.]HQE38332.1 aliphatic sulfonate ABC transporter substrate-binding protein [Zoogloea sp.]